MTLTRVRASWIDSNGYVMQELACGHRLAVESLSRQRNGIGRLPRKRLCPRCTEQPKPETAAA